jgi:TonB-linked SusC/RagA family outer membrane protein
MLGITPFNSDAKGAEFIGWSLSVANTGYHARQSESVSGQVKDATGQPLPGVSVALKGTASGTITDVEGRFLLSTTGVSSPVLVFSYIGFVRQEMAVGSRAALEVVLEQDTKALSEVVVVGYGTQKKENLTGAVSSITGKELAKRPVLRASAALQGLAPGLTVTQRSGQPGADDGTLRIRGIGTLGNAAPLVLVDGVEGELDGINPDDIESISVLKDAASASIYGSRAANGVILITTKTGKGEDLRVQYNNYIGWQEFTELPEYADAYTYMTKLNEAYANMGKTPLYSDKYLAEYQANKALDPDHYPDTDWQKEVYTGSGALQNHYLSISGGKKVNIMSSFGYQKQKGEIPGYGSERYSFRLNAKMNILDNLQTSVLLSGRHSQNTSPGAGDDIILTVNRIPSIYAARFSDGRWGSGLNGINPLAQITEGGFGENTYDSFRSSFQANFQPVEGMDLEFNYTPKYDLASGKRFIKSLPTYDVDRETPAFTVPARATLNQSNGKTWENTLRLLGKYHKSLQKHNLSLLAGFEQIGYENESMGASREGFSFPEYPQLDAGSVEFMKNSGSAAEWSLRSFFGRMNYDFGGKYLLEANIRVDGSSRFAEGYKWGTFPSFSAGWRISEEAFLQDMGWLSNLKVRASWGKLGNQLIGNYPFASVIGLGQNYVNGGQPVDGAAQLDMANSLISWETTTSSNLGVDIGFLNNKFSLTYDYYIRNTTDILLALPIPAIIGLNRPYQNAGEVKNTGWDLALNYNQAKGAFKYQVGFNLSDVENEIVDLKGTGPIIGTYTFNQEGYPINALYGYRALGLFQSQEEIKASPKQIGIYAPGDIKYADTNGDNKIGADDKVAIGNSIPRFTHGLTFNAQYKGFDLSFLLQGVAKADVLLARDAAWAFYNAGKIKTWQLDSWTPENTDASYPRLVAERTHNNYENSSYWVYDAAYARLKNLQIGYSLPQTLLSRLPIQSLRVFATGDNLFTLHNMPEGWDPERANGDAAVYPVTRTYAFGVNLGF